MTGLRNNSYMSCRGDGKLRGRRARIECETQHGRGAVADFEPAPQIVEANPRARTSVCVTGGAVFNQDAHLPALDFAADANVARLGAGGYAVPDRVLHQRLDR